MIKIAVCGAAGRMGQRIINHPMRNQRVLVCLFAMCAILSSVVDSRAEEVKPLPLDSLLGKYDGRKQVHSAKQKEFGYQIEIVSVDKPAYTLSLVAYCQDCEIKEIKRNNCQITEVKENIKFTCKKKNSDEEYVFNGESLKATGFGSKSPHTISVKKIGK